MKLEIKKLRREKHILTKSVSNVEELRREVYNMQRELLRERTRCKALEEELENPMNIHRWRKLEVRTSFFLFFFSFFLWNVSFFFLLTLILRFINLECQKIYLLTHHKFSFDLEFL